MQSSTFIRLHIDVNTKILLRDYPSWVKFLDSSDLIETRHVTKTFQSYHFCPWARQSRKDHIMVLGIFALNPLNTKIKLLSWRDLRKIGIWPWVDTLPPIQVQWPLGWNTHSIMKNSIAFTWENRKCSYDISSFLADLLQRFFNRYVMPCSSFITVTEKKYLPPGFSFWHTDFFRWVQPRSFQNSCPALRDPFDGKLEYKLVNKFNILTEILIYVKSNTNNKKEKWKETLLCEIFQYKYPLIPLQVSFLKLISEFSGIGLV